MKFSILRSKMEGKLKNRSCLLQNFKFNIKNIKENIENRLFIHSYLGPGTSTPCLFGFESNSIFYRTQNVPFLCLDKKMLLFPGGGGHWPWRLTGTCRWSLKSGPCQKWIKGKIGPCQMKKLKIFPIYTLKSGKNDQTKTKNWEIL